MPTRLTRLLLAGLALLLPGCRDGSAVRPPGAEFIVAAGDSTYWARPTATGYRLRGSPILLARIGGRFHEVYVTDDDRSYEDATFIGQRLWRRDLVRGDSVLVFEDTLVPRISRQWAADHQDARLLEPTEEEAQDPAATATVDLVVIDVHGPYLSFEYHADVEPEGGRPWHMTRRGVVDLRNGRPVTVAELFGQGAATRAIATARGAYDATLDSIRSSRDQDAEPIARSLRGYGFDPASFTLAGDASAPRVEFFVPGRGEGEAGDIAIPLDPIPMPAPSWWREVQPGLPRPDEDAASEAWERDSFTVVAEYREDGARLSVVDRARRRWTVGTVQAPIGHLHWLDTPPLDSASRRGLRRAFDEAAYYDDAVRTAALADARRLRGMISAPSRSGCPWARGNAAGRGRRAGIRAGT